MNDDTRVEDRLRATLESRAGYAPPAGDMFGALRRRRRRRRQGGVIVAAALVVGGAVTVPTLLLSPEAGTVAVGGASPSAPAGPTGPTATGPVETRPAPPPTRMGRLSFGVGWLPDGLAEVGRKAGSVNTIRTWSDGESGGWLVRLVENAGSLGDPGSAEEVDVNGRPGHLMDSYLGERSRSLMWTEGGRDFSLDVRAPAGAEAAGQAAVRIAGSLRPQVVALATPLTADVPTGYRPYEVDVEGSAPGRWAADVPYGTGSQSLHVAVGRGGAQPDDVLAGFSCSPPAGEPQRFAAGGRDLLWWPAAGRQLVSVLATDGTGGQPVSLCATDPALTRGQLAQVLLSVRVTVSTYDWIGD